MAEDARFRPAYRLGRTVGYSAVFANRRVLRGVLFDLHYRPNSVDSARLGVVIPKRNIRNAVLRNRLKRLTREAFRQRRLKLPTLDLVFRLARPADSGMIENAAVREDLERLLSRLSSDMTR